MPRPGTFPDVATTATGTNIATPDASHQANGFTNEFVPRQWLNWVFQWISKWVHWLDEREQALTTNISNISSDIEDVVNLTKGLCSIDFSGFHIIIPQVWATYIIENSISEEYSMVTLIIPRVRESSGTDYIRFNLSSIPLAARPLEDVSVPIAVYDNGSISPGVFYIDSAEGVVRIIKYGFFATQGSKGFDTLVIKYPVAR